MRSSALLLPLGVLFLLAACMSPSAVQQTMTETEEVLQKANAVHARLCAPEELANAESSADFARVESHQGYVRRAGEHAIYANRMAKAALEKATPCGTADFDQDTIADVIDRCPKEPEDFDGVDDEDGCRDIDPYGDDDRDGIINIDDACIDDPEDFDGHNDEDGCPESDTDADGDTIPDHKDACPHDAEDFDGFQDVDGCPDPDNDEDGIADIHDQCPRIPEDLDDWEDDDGCPEPDNDQDGLPDESDDCPNEPGPRDNNGCPTRDRDGDGIADENDRCPDDPETYNKYLDEDGCPDKPPSRVKVTKTRIEINETIQFATGSADLLPASFPVLNDVVQVLRDSPHLNIRVEGHTDSQGSDAYNMKLSQSRAESVLTFMVKAGVETTRLTAVGFGETRPIDTNRTAEGRQVNRRVEFHIVQ